MSTFKVINLASGMEYIYSEPNNCNCEIKAWLENRIESLITVAMLDDKMSSHLHEPKYRDQYKDKITLGTQSAAIGDWCVSIRF